MRIIIEAGINWITFNEAVEYAEKAKELNADIIKYQYVKDNSKYSKMNKGEWKALKEYCDKIGIEFLATPSSYEIFLNLMNIGMINIKIGSDKVNSDLPGNILTWLNNKNNKNDNTKKVFISNGYSEILQESELLFKFYCVSLYPCDKKFIDFDKMSNKKYIGFSDHTLEYNKEWSDKIKACKNIQYVEKHFKLKAGVVDDNVSLNYEQMKEFINNLKD
jgi:sialic acid synthase SpsE